jgi:hypothetical protein
LWGFALTIMLAVCRVGVVGYAAGCV